MPPNSSGTIDSIKVALGLDVSKFNQDIKRGLGNFAAPIQLQPPTETQLAKFAKDISALMTNPDKAKRLGVKVAVTFDETQTKNALQTVLDAVSKEVHLEVPVDFVKGRMLFGEDDIGGGGGGGGAGPGTPSGRRGGPQAPAAGPAAPSASSTAGAVATNTVTGAQSQPTPDAAPRRGGGRVPSAPQPLATAGAVLTNAVITNPDVPPVVAKDFTHTESGRTIKVKAGTPAGTPVGRAYTSGDYTVQPTVSDDAKGVRLVSTKKGAKPAAKPAAKRPAAKAAATSVDAAAAHQQEIADEFARQFAEQMAAREAQAPAAGSPEPPEDLTDIERLYGPKSNAPESVKKLFGSSKGGGVSPPLFWAVNQAAYRDQPMPTIPKGTRNAQGYRDLYEYGRQIAEAGYEHRVGLQTAGTGPKRRGRNAAKKQAAETEQGKRLLDLIARQDWEAIDEMFPGPEGWEGPGVGSALATGNVAQALGVYYSQQYPGEATWAEGTSYEGRAKAIDRMGSQFTQLRSKEPNLAAQWPLDTAMLTGAAFVRQAKPDEQGGWVLPYAHRTKDDAHVSPQAPRNPAGEVELASGKKVKTHGGFRIKRPTPQRDPRWPVFEWPQAVRGPRGGAPERAQVAALAELASIRSGWTEIDYADPTAGQKVDELLNRRSKAYTSLLKTRGGKEIVDKSRAVEKQLDELWKRETATGMSRTDIAHSLLTVMKGGTIADLWPTTDPKELDKLKLKLSGLQGGGPREGERFRYSHGRSKAFMAGQRWLDWMPGRQVEVDIRRGMTEQMLAHEDELGLTRRVQRAFPHALIQGSRGVSLDDFATDLSMLPREEQIGLTGNAMWFNRMFPRSASAMEYFAFAPGRTAVGRFVGRTTGQQTQPLGVKLAGEWDYPNEDIGKIARGLGTFGVPEQELQKLLREHGIAGNEPVSLLHALTSGLSKAGLDPLARDPAGVLRHELMHVLDIERQTPSRPSASAAFAWNPRRNDIPFSGTSEYANEDFKRSRDKNAMEAFAEMGSLALSPDIEQRLADLRRTGGHPSQREIFQADRLLRGWSREEHGQDYGPFPYRDGGVRLFPRKGGDPFGAFTDKKGDLTLMRRDWWMPGPLTTGHALGPDASPERRGAFEAEMMELARRAPYELTGLYRDEMVLDERLLDLYRSFGIQDPLSLTSGPYLAPNQKITAWGRSRAWGRPHKGTLDLHFDRAGELEDVFPHVPPNFRRRGIGTALYEYAEALGLPAESISDQNSSYGGQTDLGSALWRSRKRKQGWSDNEILEQWMLRFADDADTVSEFEQARSKLLAKERAGKGPQLYAMGGLLDRVLQAKVQKLMDEGRTKESQALQKMLEDRRGGWSPPPTPKTGMYGGGHRPSSLNDLPGVAANIAGITEVGEQGREWIVRQHDGSEFVVPNHQLSHFRSMVGLADGGDRDDGPFKGWHADRPEEVAQRIRAKTLATPRDLRRTGLYVPRRDERGRIVGPQWGIPNVVPRPGFSGIELMDADLVTNRGPGPAGLGILGQPQGTYESKRYAAHVASMEAGVASSIGIASRDIQRVMVTNWPAALETGVLGGEPLASKGPGRPSARSPETEIKRTQTDEEVLADPETSGLATKPGRATPYGKAIAKMVGAESVIGLRADLDQVGIDISEALQKSPVRALSVAMGQIAQTMVGGRAGILQRAGEARAARGRAEGLTSDLEAAVRARDVATQEIELFAKKTLNADIGRNEAGMAEFPIELRNKLSEKDQDTLGNLFAEEAEQEFRRQFFEPRAKEATEAAKAQAKGILTPGQQLKAQAVGLAGIVGGTMMFTIAMHAAQSALQGIATVASSAADALTGFVTTTNQATSEMADSILKVSGDVSAAMGGAAGRVGLPAGTDLSALASRSEAMAGARNLQEQRDLLRAQANLAGQQGGLVRQGVGTGFNNGPLAGIPVIGAALGWLGQQQGAAELTAGRFTGLGMRPLSQIEDRRARELAPQSPQYNAQVEAEIDRLVTASGVSRDLSAYNAALSRGEFVEDLNPETGQVTGFPDWLAQQREGFRSLAERNLGIERANLLTGGGYRPEDAMNFDAIDAAWQKTVDAEVDTLNKSLKKVDVGDYFTQFDVDAPTAADVKNMQAFAKSMNAIGAGAYTGSFLEKGVMATTTEGEAIDPARLNRMLAALLESALKPTLPELLKTSERSFQAQVSGIYRSAELTRGTELPSEFFMNLISRPPMGGQFGINRPWSTGISAPGATGAEAAIGERYGRRIARTYGRMEPYAEKGREALVALAQSPDEEKQILREVAAVEKLGASIGRLQAKASDLQLTVEVEQYNEQLFQTQRSLTDVLTILGKTQGATSELGRLQRAQISDQRELTRIQLARSQRELNMEVAISRLRAPGETAEERAIRMEEAMIAAREKQRELDINKGMAGRGFRIEDIGFERQARDLAKQMELITEARDVTIEVRGIQNLLEAKNQLLGVRQSVLGVSKSVGLEIKKAGNQIMQGLESELGVFTEEAFAIVTEWVDRTVSQFLRLRDAYGGKSKPERPTKGRGAQPGTKPMAAGGIFDTLGATAFVAGEAGPERVVVMRNPRVGMTPPPTGLRAIGRGGSPVNISLNLNASVSNQADEDRLARKIARMLHNEAALLVGA